MKRWMGAVTLMLVASLSGVRHGDAAPAVKVGSACSQVVFGETRLVPGVGPLMCVRLAATRYVWAAITPIAWDRLTLGPLTASLFPATTSSPAHPAGTSQVPPTTQRPTTTLAAIAWPAGFPLEVAIAELPERMRSEAASAGASTFSTGGLFGAYVVSVGLRYPSASVAQAWMTKLSRAVSSCAPTSSTTETGKVETETATTLKVSKLGDQTVGLRSVAKGGDVPVSADMVYFRRGPLVWGVVAVSIVAPIPSVTSLAKVLANRTANSR